MDSDLHWRLLWKFTHQSIATEIGSKHKNTGHLWKCYWSMTYQWCINSQEESSSVLELHQPGTKVQPQNLAFLPASDRNEYGHVAVSTNPPQRSTLMLQRLPHSSRVFPPKRGQSLLPQHPAGPLMSNEIVTITFSTPLLETLGSRSCFTGVLSQ